MGCTQPHAAAGPPQTCTDRVVNFCPWCGNTVTEADAKFCTQCGGMFPDAELRAGEYPAYGPHDRIYARTAKKRSRTGPAVAVAVLLIAGAFGVLFVGGVSDMEIRYEGEDFVFTNTSKGVFGGYTWTILDQHGNAVISKEMDAKSSVRWTPPDIKAEDDTDRRYSMKLTAHSLLGYGQAASKEFGLRSYDVVWGENEEHRVTVSMHLGEYQQYLNYDFDGISNRDARWPGTYADQRLVDTFMSTETQNSAFAGVTRQLKEQVSGMSDEGAVNHLAGFVQNLDGEKTYKYDTKINGEDEYWSFPIETLFHKGGDCEDLAMLLMALIRECFGGRLNVALALFMEEGVEGHAMAAVSLSEPPSAEQQWPMVPQDTDGYVADGLTYYTCETTLAGCTVGMIDSKYNEQPTMLIVAS